MRLIPHIVALCLALLWIVATVQPKRAVIACYYADHTLITDSAELYPILRAYSELQQTSSLPLTNISIQTSLFPGLYRKTAAIFGRFKDSLLPSSHNDSDHKYRPRFAFIVTDNHTENICLLSSNFSNVKTDPTRNTLFLAYNKNLVDLLIYLEKGHHPLESYPDSENKTSLKSAFVSPPNSIIKGLETRVSNKDRRHFYHRLGWPQSHSPGNEATLTEVMSLFSAIRHAGNITPPNLITQVTHFKGKILYRKPIAEIHSAITPEAARRFEEIVRYDLGFNRANFREFNPHPTAGLRVPTMESGICLIEVYQDYTLAIHYAPRQHGVSTETQRFQHHLAYIVNETISQLQTYKRTHP